MDNLQTEISTETEVEIIEQPKCAFCDRDAEDTRVQPALCDKHIAIGEMVYLTDKYNLAATLANVRVIYNKFPDYWCDRISYGDIPDYYWTLRWFNLFTPDYLLPLFPEAY